MAGSQEVQELQFHKKVIKIPEKSALKVSRLQASQFSARLSEFDRSLYIVSILYEQESLFPRFYWRPHGHKMCKIFSKLSQMYKREFFKQPVPSVQPRFCFISRCCLIFLYDQEYLNNFIFFWQCECDVEYNDIFFHIVGHYMNYTSEYIRAQLAKYITKYMDTVWVVAGDFLKAKGLTVEDYLLHISQLGNRADELAIYLVSRFCQKYIGVITKYTVWFTGQDTSIEDCPIVLVYLGEGHFVIQNLKLANVSGNCLHQWNVRNLTVTLCMTQNHHGDPLCHTGTPGPWVLHHPSCHHLGQRRVQLSKVNLMLQSQNPGGPGS